MKNLLPKEQGMVTIEFDERNAVVTLESYRMVCRLIEGRYPNYNSVIPQNNPYKVTVDRQQLIGALRRVSIFSSQASSLIKLRMPDCDFGAGHRLLHFGGRNTDLPVYGQSDEHRLQIYFPHRYPE
jgi:DNA polymerase III sliding clamp (beta) subunit (PCNA family)